MAITLPLPFRVAAGILGTGIDLVRSLPDDIPALPVTLVGNAMKLSIKVQQEIATLATRGDELLGGVIGGAEENPAWAKFDDDEPAQPVRPTRPVSKLKTAPEAKPAADAVVSTTPDNPPAGKPGKPGPRAQPGGNAGAVAGSGAERESSAERESGTGPQGTEPADDDAPTLATPEATSMPPTVTTAMDAAIDVGEALIEEALVAVDESTTSKAATADADSEIASEVTEAIEDAVALDVVAEVTEALEDAVALEVAAEVTEALEDAVAQELVTEVTAALEDALAAEAATPLDASLIDASPIDASPIDAEDFTENPVVFEETEELTETLPVPPELLEEVVAATEAEGAESDGPDALPDYDQMTLAQVRGHLRELSSDEVSALLRYEQDGDARPPFLTLLSNRLVTLDAQTQ